MAIPQGKMSFPGISRILSGSFTLSHGITPSAAIVEMTPQPSLIAANGTLSITYGTVALKFDGCRVRSGSIRRDGAGNIVSLVIDDRRWKWGFAKISGVYNLKKANGEIDTQDSDEKTPQELAKLCLTALKESGFDVSDLPNESRPECNWIFANPAQELQELCDSLGCRVVLGLNGLVRICRLGDGRDLPRNSKLIAASFGLESQGRPDSIEFVGGETLWQSKLLLEAVGLDTDYRVRKIDDLAYKPSAGWEKFNPDGAALEITNKANRKLALQTVFRWYRVKSQANRVLAPPNYSGQVALINQLLPLRTKLLTRTLGKERDTDDLRMFRELDPFVEGTYWPKNWDYANVVAPRTDTNGNTTVGQKYVAGFSIDAERGIVQFSDSVYKLVSGGTLAAADLYLTCAYAVKDIRTKQEHRFSRSRSLAGPKAGTGPKIIRDDSIYLTRIVQYGGRIEVADGERVEVPTRVASVEVNDSTVNRDAGYTIDAAMKELQAPESTDAEYSGILSDIDLDGTIQQITWSVGTGPATTRASRNNEFNLAVPSYKEINRRLFVAALHGQLKTKGLGLATGRKRGAP